MNIPKRSVDNYLEEELKDDNIIKINKIHEQEFVNEMKNYVFPFCQKDESHSNNQLKFTIVKKKLNQLESGNNKNNLFDQIEPVCDVCIEQNKGSVLDMKEFLLTTYHIANQQCDRNFFKECINETLILLEESLKQLNEMKERISIYYDEVKEKIDHLQQKAQFYPPIYVRDILTRVKDSKDTSQDEKYSTIINELAKLSSQIFIDERMNFSPILKGAELDVSLYYLLLHKIKSDTNMINQCIDRGCFILNDIDQSENMPHYGEKIIKNIRQQGLNKNNHLISTDKRFLEYKKKMQFIGLQENEISVDTSIDFHILYMYEQYKFQGIQNAVNNNFNNMQCQLDKPNQVINQNGRTHEFNQCQQSQLFQHRSNYQNPNINQSIVQQQQNHLKESNCQLQKQPSSRRIKIFNHQYNEKENRSVFQQSQQSLKNNVSQNKDKIESNEQ